jgi:hypothetical protein
MVKHLMLSHTQERSEEEGFPVCCMAFFFWSFCGAQYDEESQKEIVTLLLDQTLDRILDLMLDYKDTSKKFYFYAFKLLLVLVEYLYGQVRNPNNAELQRRSLTVHQKLRIVEATKKTDALCGLFFVSQLSAV